MKLTVAIPSYRRPLELRRALEAMSKQDRQADEVMVVARHDDTRTHDVAREFSAILPINLQLVEGSGVVVAMSKAMDAATGDLIAYIDDDAVPHPDWAGRIVRTFEAEPDLVGLGGRDHIFVDGIWLDGEAREVGIVHWYGRVVGGHHLGVGSRRDVDCLKGVNMSFRREAIGKLRMDGRLRGAGAQWHFELMFCLELRAQGKRLAYDPSIVVDHILAQRHDEDQRANFNALAFENQIHNLTLALLEHLRPAGKAIFLSDALLMGVLNGYCGLLKGLYYWPKFGPREAWQRTAASARGVREAWKTWRIGRVIPA